VKFIFSDENRRALVRMSQSPGELISTKDLAALLGVGDWVIRDWRSENRLSRGGYFLHAIRKKGNGPNLFDPVDVIEFLDKVYPDVQSLTDEELLDADAGVEMHPKYMKKHAPCFDYGFSDVDTDFLEELETMVCESRCDLLYMGELEHVHLVCKHCRLGKAALAAGERDRGNGIKEVVGRWILTK